MFNLHDKVSVVEESVLLITVR